MYSKYTQDLDDKYGWNDPFLTSRTLSQPNTVGAASVRKHRPDSTAPVLHATSRTTHCRQLSIIIHQAGGIL